MEKELPNDGDIRAQLAEGAIRLAFEALLARYQSRVYGLIFSMLPNEASAQDLLQDVFQKIWKALPGFQGQASFSSWIYTITRNATLTELKKKRPCLSLDDPELDEDLISESQVEASSGGEKTDVMALLAELPEKYRRVVILFYLEQKSYGEVAQMLAIPIGTVKTLLHRGKKELVRIGARNPPPVPLAGGKHYGV